jgi:hypothetical protein
VPGCALVTQQLNHVAIMKICSPVTSSALHIHSVNCTYMSQGKMRVDYPPATVEQLKETSSLVLCSQITNFKLKDLYV